MLKIEPPDVRVTSNKKETQWKSRSRLQLFAVPSTAACPAPLSMVFSRQECWSGLPFASLGDLLDTGIKPRSSACRQILYQLEPLGKRSYKSGISQKKKLNFRKIKKLRYSLTEVSELGENPLYFGYIACVAPLEWFSHEDLLRLILLLDFLKICLLSSMLLVTSLHLPCRKS